METDLVTCVCRVSSSCCSTSLSSPSSTVRTSKADLEINGVFVVAPEDLLMVVAGTLKV